MASADFNPILPTISEQPPSLYKDLLEEIWRIILKKLTNQDALNLRLVDSDFKTKVDTLYDNWSVRLDEDSPHFDMILDLRVKEVIVNRLLNPVPNRTPGIIFKYPELITKLSVDIATISGENLYILLQCKNMKVITIRFWELGCNVDEFWETLDPEIGFNFPELHTLTMSLPNDPEMLTSFSCYERLMTQSIMPNLRSLQVDWSLYKWTRKEDVYECSSILLTFLGEHGQRLKHFTYCNSLPSKYSNEYSSLLDQKPLFTNCSALETLTICDSSHALQYSWKELVQIQSNLTEIQLRYKYTGFAFSSSLCALIAANNYETLSKVIIEGIQFEEDEIRFDISIFRKCINLRYLKLVSTTKAVELLNLLNLPKQIETIELQDFFIPSEDFSRLLKNCDSLSEIKIVGAGTSGQFGVNFFVFESILKHNSLKSVRLEPNSIHKSQSELVKINEIYSRLVSGNVTNVTNILDARFYLWLKKSADSNGTFM